MCCVRDECIENSFSTFCFLYFYAFVDSSLFQVIGKDGRKEIWRSHVCALIKPFSEKKEEKKKSTITHMIANTWKFHSIEMPTAFSSLLDLLFLFFRLSSWAKNSLKFIQAIQIDRFRRAKERIRHMKYGNKMMKSYDGNSSKPKIIPSTANEFGWTDYIWFALRSDINFFFFVRKSFWKSK